MRKVKKITALVLVCVMVFAMSTTAFAAENTAADSPIINTTAIGGSSDGGIAPCATTSKSVGNNYVNMTGNDLRSSHGSGTFDYRVTSSGYNGWVYQIDCLMFDINGNVVWRGDNICGVAASGTLEYGSNVARIDLRIAPRLAVTVAAYYTITVTY